MKFLIIGGSGFLGSHVADYLTSEGHNVSIFDQLKSKYLSKNQNFILGDLDNENLLNFSMKNIDYVFNFAAIAGLREAKNNPLETIRQNIHGALLPMIIANKNKVKKYFFASSVYVYSDKGSFYRCSKQAAENYIVEYAKNSKIKYTILRYGSLYGPRSGDENGLYKIIKFAIQNKKITYEGDPNSIRAYIHVLDAARTSLVFLEKKFDNKIINLLGKENIKIEDLMLMIKEILRINTKINFKRIKDNSNYIITPYSYQDNIGVNYQSNLSIDFGQGILQLIHELKSIKKG
jgi:UDP-glucose 4-epimerase